MRTIRIVLADDHAVVRSGYRRLIELEDDLLVVAEFADGESAYSWLVQHEADVLVLDLSMPGRGGLETLTRLKQRLPQLRVLIFTMHDSAAMVTQALRAGADAYLTKSSSPELLIDAIARVCRDERVLSDDVRQHDASRSQGAADSPQLRLTPREFEIFKRLIQGETIEQIADTLCLSAKTVFNYQTMIRRKLGVESAVELLRLALQHERDG